MYYSKYKLKVEFNLNVGLYFKHFMFRENWRLVTRKADLTNRIVGQLLCNTRLPIATIQAKQCRHFRVRYVNCLCSIICVLTVNPDQLITTMPPLPSSPTSQQNPFSSFRSFTSVVPSFSTVSHSPYTLCVPHELLITFFCQLNYILLLHILFYFHIHL